MAACDAPTTFRCDMCRLDFSSALQLAFHVIQAKTHKRKLYRVAHEQVKELLRLWYFLDTYMKEEPILGLEYIVEEQLRPKSYWYTCQLCHKGGDPYNTFTHIVSNEHMLRYVEKHHPSFLVINGNHPLESPTLGELRDIALAIHKEYGRKEMQRIRSEGNSAAEQEPASSILVKTKAGYICTICDVLCSQYFNLFKHIIGNKHQRKLLHFSPGGVKKLSRMQDILDNYIKEDGVVGLEYIVERQVSGSYRYTCSLCNVETDLCISLCHVLGERHMKRYISKHYSCMMPKREASFTKVGYVGVLREIALTIQMKYGRKHIRTSGSSVSGSSLAEEARPLPTEVVRSSPTEEARPLPTEEARPLLTEEVRPSPTEEARPLPTEEARPSPTEEARPLPPDDVSEESGPFLHDGEGLGNCRPCRLCNMVFPSPVDLWKHVVGSKHKEILGKTSPEELKELGSLQYFLNNHMKKDPLLGLEYIVEEQLDSTSYKYTCQLCNVEGDLPQMLTHISYVDHVERYIDKDHSDLSLRVYTYPNRADYIKALTIIAFIILDKCGRQDIVLKCN